MGNYIGEIRMIASGAMPAGWLSCNGQSLPIADYQELFVYIGTRFGGNGTSHFNLPDMRGRVPVGAGQAPGLSQYTYGQKTGYDMIHQLLLDRPQANTLPLLPTSRDAVTPWPLTMNGEQSIMQPSATFNFIISYKGDFPRD